MPPSQLSIHAHPQLANARMVIGLSGWMDGGEVSTGTLEFLADLFEAKELASIAPDDFYIYNVPGSMEVSSLFRPHATMEEGLITSFEEPQNRFLFNEEHNLILFQGKEPNIHWKEYAECIFAIVEAFDVQLICFAGSIAGLLPHTRPTEFYCTASNLALRTFAENHNSTPTNYEGPVSIVTYLIKYASERNIDMMTLLAAVPAYVQGRNFTCIQSAIKRLAVLMNTPMASSTLSELAKEYERELESFVKSNPDLAAQIRKLEQAYDNQSTDPNNEDMQNWFNKQDIR